MKKYSGRNKYNVGSKDRRTVDGIVFDSIKESKRYLELRLMERAGVIKRLKMQVPFPLEVDGKVIAKYKADFVYFDDGTMVVEDVKGVKTPIYRRNKKHMKAQYGIEILET